MSGAPRPEGSATRATILIVEDDIEVRQLLRITLARGPYDLVEAVDGEKALAAARRTRPRLILLDVQLPTLDGLAVCRQVKADPDLRGTRVLMLTAAAGDEDRAKGITAGADGYLTKPFGPTVLLERVAEELARP